MTATVSPTTDSRGRRSRPLRSFLVGLIAVLIPAASAREATGQAQRSFFPPLNGAHARLLIGVGEVHGASENAAFLRWLTEDLIARGYAVHVFLEVPPGALDWADRNQPRDAGAALSRTDWWSSEVQDGRRGAASACWIWSVRDHPRIFLHEMDVATGEEDREAGMANAVVEEMRGGSGARVAAVMVAGNFHILPIPGKANAFTRAKTALADYQSYIIDVSSGGGAIQACDANGCGERVLPENRASLGFHFNNAENLWSYGFPKFTPQSPAVPALNESGFSQLCGH